MAKADAIVYGVASPQDIAALSGRQVLQAILDGKLPAPPMAGTLGFLLVEVGDGFAAFEGETGAHLLNPIGTVHGGWAMAMIDSVTFCAAISAQPPGVACTTIETKVNFTRQILADTGRVRAEGRILARGRQIVTADAKMTDARGRLLAHGTSTLLAFGPSRP